VKIDPKLKFDLGSRCNTMADFISDLLYSGKWQILL
jgi:hypothetical protein